ncbi:MAG: FkbM family methyltransferase [Prosthecobacter sp.]|uniref:FkbM family methyltransferase n=1 Tax=Prosthecobacter sp. TaxID=1965333 RepID=UPI0038FDB47B
MTIALPSLASFWEDFRTRWYFKFTLPACKEASLHGIKLDISALSSLMKNHILQGRYEYQERLLARRCLSCHDVVLELGGAIGYIGLYCRKIIGVRHHLTVEANPRTIEMMCRNYALNYLKPQVVHAAAAAADGQLRLDIGGEFWENSIVTRSAAENQITVPAHSLRSLVAMLPEPPTALICDIEGAEEQLDFTQLPASVTKIIIELHPAIIGAEVVEGIVRNLHALGFRTDSVEENTWLFRR